MKCLCVAWLAIVVSACSGSHMGMLDGAATDGGASPEGGPFDGGPGPDGPPIDTGMPPEPCEAPGTIETIPCGRCGTQQRFCTAARTWEYTACTDSPSAVCDPGTTSTQPCGRCGTEESFCNTICAWTATGACVEPAGAECAPSEIGMRACGLCGSEPLECDDSCHWSSTGSCVDGPGAMCSPGATSMVACGMCGTESATCDDTCQWTATGACTGESGVCVPGSVEFDSTGCAAGSFRRGVCGSDCTYAYGSCVAFTDADGDGDPYAVDCDDSNPMIRRGSTRPCGAFRCGTATTSVMGTATCIGPGWGTCARPAGCSQATCTPFATEFRTCPTECLPGPTQSRTCTSGGTWGAFSTCMTSTRPASCAVMPSACGVCNEGTEYSYCNGSCRVVTTDCMGEGCTPGTTTRSTTGCPMGEYSETTCSASCMPGTPTMCMPYPPDIDVIILVDVTGSHTSLVMSNAMALATELTSPLLTDADVRVGVAIFADFPVGMFGSPPDVPFRGLLTPSSSASMVETTLATLPALGGGDGPESGVQALFELAGGASHPTSEPFSCGAGTGAGGCWRPGAQRIVVMLTDITQHNGPDPDSPSMLLDPYGALVTPPAATWPMTRTLMNTERVGLFAIVPMGGGFGSDPEPQLRVMVTELGQDPAQSVTTYPAFTADLTTAIRTTATRLRAYVGL